MFISIVTFFDKIISMLSKQMWKVSALMIKFICVTLITESLFDVRGYMYVCRSSLSVLCLLKYKIFHSNYVLY